MSGHTAYIAREGRYAERTGYKDLEATSHGNLPAWAEGEPALFWNAADWHERANRTIYREIKIALSSWLERNNRAHMTSCTWNGQPTGSTATQSNISGDTARKNPEL